MKDVIYLQIEKDKYESTWCDDRLHNSDITYVKLSFIADWLSKNFLPGMSFEETMKAQRELVKIIDDNE